MDHTNNCTKDITVLGWRHPHMVNETSEIEQLTYQLSLLDYRIHTGAGGGFMESANRGAFKANPNNSFGYTIPNFDDEIVPNIILSENIFTCNTFHIRKKILLSKPFLIFCPGGMGTLDEFTEIITMKKMGLCNPYILCYSKDFWLSFKKGLTSTHQEMSFPDDLIDVISDDVQELYSFIVAQSSIAQPFMS